MTERKIRNDRKKSEMTEKIKNDRKDGHDGGT